MRTSIDSIQIPSECLGRSVACNILVPEHPSGKWLLLLHGYGGDEREWLSKSPIAALAARYRLTLVMPGCGDGYYEDTREPMGQFLGEELPAWLRSRYPLSPDREDAYLCGASMGGFGALLAGSRYGSVFSRIVSLGGAFIVSDVAIGNPGVLGRNADVRYFRRVFGDFATLEGSDRDPIARAAQAVSRGQMPRVYLLCGTEDVLFRCNEKTKGQLDALGIRAELNPVPGGHRWETWNPHLEAVVQWLLTG